MRERSPGSWRITVSARFDPLTGKRRQRTRTVRGTRASADRALTKLLREVDQGLVADPGRLTLAEYLEDQWLSHMRTRLEATTFERYDRAIRQHIVPELGAVKMSKLTPLHIQSFEARKLEDGRLDGKGRLSGRTVLNIHRVLSEALRQAVRWQVIPTNPAEAVQPPRQERTKLVVVDPLLAGSILATARGTRVEVPVILAIGGGLRRGEVLGLRWSDVDLERALIRVRQTLKSTTTNRWMGSPKTIKSRRQVSIPGFVVEGLRRHRAAQAERRLLAGPGWHDLDLVVDRGDGQWMEPSVLSTAFMRMVRRADLPRVRFHDLRHGFATLMLAADVPLKVVSEMMGHATIGITADIYASVIPSLQVEAASRLDSLLNTGVTETVTN